MDTDKNKTLSNSVEFEYATESIYSWKISKTHIDIKNVHWNTLDEKKKNYYDQAYSCSRDLLLSETMFAQLRTPPETPRTHRVLSYWGV